MEFKYLEEECEAEKKPLLGKKGKRVVLVTILVLIVVGIAKVVSLFGTQLLAASSIKTLEDDFYYMEYKGDYGFDELLAEGGVSDDDELLAHIMEQLYHNLYAVEVGKGNYGCSTLRTTMEDGTVLFGRNFDYNSRKTMVVTTEPENGYKSISTCNIEFFGMRGSWEPDQFEDKMRAISAVYAPVDGMNEKGVCVGVLSVSAGYPTNQSTDKPDITTTTAVRLILDKAASVDEAIELLQQYDMHASIGGRFKFAIADATGKSVTVEYINDEMSVIEVDACSNFYQTPGPYYGMGLNGPCPRYAKLMEGFQKYNGKITEDEMMNVMASASQKYFHHNNTQWTVVFNTKELTATYCYFEDFETKYHFDLNKNTLSVLESDVENEYMAGSETGRYEKMLFDEIDVVTDVTYSVVQNNQELKLDIRMPKEDTDELRPAVVLVHGGGLTGGDKANAGIVRSMSEEFAQMGYVTFNVNYRLASVASQSALDSAMEDVEASIKWIRENAKEYGVDKDRISLVGYSAGADIIINMCYGDHCDNEVRQSIKVVISLSGGGLYYNMTKEEVPPCILIHGTNDTTVPYSRSQNFYNSLQKVNNDVILYPLEGLNHTLTTRYEEIRNQAAMFLYKQFMGVEVVINIKSPVSVEYKSVLERMENGIHYQVNVVDLTLDGKLDEWNNASKIQLNGLKDAGDNLPKGEDFEGFAVVGWNPSEAGKIYLGLQITDDEIKNTVTADGKWYNDDCIEMVLDVSWDGNAEQVLKYVVGATGEDLSVLANEDSTKCQVVRQGTRTTYEIILDLNNLPQGTLESLDNISLSPECEIGFNISYNDCENGAREHQIGWVPGVSNDRSNMGNLKFMAEKQ